MNNIECARKNIISPLIKKISRLEPQKIDVLINNIASGKTVILKNKIRSSDKLYKIVDS